jgi:hypothetical protein
MIAWTFLWAGRELGQVGRLVLDRGRRRDREAERVRQMLPSPGPIARDSDHRRPWAVILRLQEPPAQPHMSPISLPKRCKEKQGNGPIPDRYVKSHANTIVDTKSSHEHVLRACGSDPKCRRWCSQLKCRVRQLDHAVENRSTSEPWQWV